MATFNTLYAFISRNIRFELYLPILKNFVYHIFIMMKCWILWFSAIFKYMSDNRERANLIFDRIPNIECLKNCNLSRLKISKARNIFLFFVDWNKIEFIHTCFQIMNIDINDIFISIKYAWFNERLIKSIWYLIWMN